MVKILNKGIRCLTKLVKSSNDIIKKTFILWQSFTYSGIFNNPRTSSIKKSVNNHTLCVYLFPKNILPYVFISPVLNIPNGCLDAYEVKVNIDIFKYQEKVKLISQFQRFFFIFQWHIRVYVISLEPTMPSNYFKDLVFVVS